MTRVQNRAANAHSKKTSTALTNRKKKPYKIVFESVTQEKKKLRSAVSYNAQAPLGYTFVPAGTPDLTEYCKELCRTRGKEVHIVSAAPKNRAHNNPGRISHHIHRVGHHFPSGIVDKACDWLGYTRKNGIFTKHLDVGINSHFARSLAKHKKQLGKDPSETTDEEIRAAIKDLFPKIPDRDVTSILNHAFRQGTKRVGNAKELTLPRRIQLAVLAHIRHVYTDYDKVLKQSEWMDARRHVEPACLNQLLKWRGEDESGPTELEDIFRETIIIDDSDDEDSENPIADASDSGIERAPSVEIISERANARDLLTNDLNNVDWIDADSTQHVPNRAYFVRSKPKVKLVPINLQPRDLPLRERQYIPESPLRRTTYDAHLGIRTEMVPSTADYAAGRSFHFSSNSDSIRPYSTSSGTVINNQPPNSHFVEWNGKLYESEKYVHRDPSRVLERRETRLENPYLFQSHVLTNQGSQNTSSRYIESERRPVAFQESYPSALRVFQHADERDIAMPSIEHDHDRLSFPSNSDKTLTPRQHYGRPGFEHCTGTSKVHFPEKRKSLPLPPVSNFSNDLTDKRAKQDSQIVGEDRFIQQYSGQAFGFRRTFQPGRRITPPNTRPLEIVDLTHSAEKPKSTGIWPYDCSLSSLSSPQDRYNVSEFQQASMNANMPRQGACGSTSSRTHFDRSDQGSQRTETVRIDGQREYKSQVPPRVLDNSFSTLSEKGHTSAQGYAPQHFPATHQVQGELLRAPDIQTQHSYFLPSNSQFFSLIKPSNTSSYSSPHRPLPVKRSSDQEYGDVGRRFVENDLHQQSAFQFNRGVSSHASLNGYSMEERGGHRDLSGSMVMPSTVEGDRHGHHTLEVVRDVHNRSLPPASGNYHDAMDIDGYGRRLYKAA